MLSVGGSVTYGDLTLQLVATPSCMGYIQKKKRQRKRKNSERKKSGEEEYCVCVCVCVRVFFLFKKKVVEGKVNIMKKLGLLES